MELQYDTGLGDLVSMGAKTSFLFNTNEEENADQFGESDEFAKLDLGLFLRFHFSDVLNISGKVDPYLGLNASFRSLGAEGGLKYSFSETLGLYVQYSQSFSSVFIGLNDEDYYGKKSYIAAGLTIYP